MQLTGKQIAEEGIITGYDAENAIQQAGIDLRVAEIHRCGGTGIIPATGKTVLPTYQKLEPDYSINDKIGWLLEPGYYEITLKEGCKVPNNRSFTLVQRSSLLRCGAIIRSSQFDPGFETDHIGTFILACREIFIEKDARVCQTIVLETAEVAKEDLYTGQFQNDSQRKA